MNKRTLKHISHFSWSYYIFSGYVILMHNLFYRKVVVEGKENIPKEGPIIYAPNHQNALMDALAILVETREQIVFLARADIFNMPLLPAFFRWLKILPVYRIRDGKDNLKNNEFSFDAAIKVLKNKRSIGLFPEAAHSNKRRLLGFKKGIPRIAFQAEEENDFKLGIKIIPVGIYYSRYNRFRSILHIRYGKPINVSDYEQEYKENEKKALISLRDKMKEGTKPLVIDIRKLDFYDMYESVRTLYVKNMVKRLQLGQFNQNNRFIADKMTVSALDKFADENPAEMDSLKRKIVVYNKYCNKYQLSNQSISKEKINIFRLLWNLILLILFLPVFLYGFINNFVPYILPKILVLKVKDKQFHSSIKFIWALFVLPIFYLIQFFIFLGVSNDLLLSLAYLLSIPITGMLAQLYSEWFALIRRDFWLYRIKKTNKKVFNHIRSLHSDIISYLDRILAVGADSQE